MLLYSALFLLIYQINAWFNHCTQAKRLVKLQMLAHLIYSRVKYQAILFCISSAQIHHNNDKLRSL